jgi:hypothetical protein
MYKIEVQHDDGRWADERGEDGAILTFATAADADAGLAARHPVLTQLGRYVGPARTRVVAIWSAADDEDWSR